MNQATWHSPSGLRHSDGFFRGFKHPSEDVALLLAVGSIVAAVVILHMRGAVPPRADDTAGISIEAVAQAPVAVSNVPALVAPSAPIAVPPAPVLTSPDDTRPAQQPLVAPAVLRPQSIRAVEIDALPAMSNLVAQTGLSVDPALVSYGDVAGLGEIGLVPMQSGGSGGTLAIAVLSMGNEGPQVLALLTPDTAERGRMRVATEGGQIVASIGVLGPEDPLCCPSQTKSIYYYWNGSNLLMDHQLTTVNAPGAKDLRGD